MCDLCVSNHLEVFGALTKSFLFGCCFLCCLGHRPKNISPVWSYMNICTLDQHCIQHQPPWKIKVWFHKNVGNNQTTQKYRSCIRKMFPRFAHVDFFSSIFIDAGVDAHLWGSNTPSPWSAQLIRASSSVTSVCSSLELHGNKKNHFKKLTRWFFPEGLQY